MGRAFRDATSLPSPPAAMPPLKDLLVLDFSTLLPGPLATLFLADAGARVVKVERPATGDAMRDFAPAIGDEGVSFALLNRGKSSVALDLKDPGAKDRLLPLLKAADVIVEQFRPGVMARLGLGYEDVRAINPDIIYCSITGWGGAGPKADAAGHDLNYMAETGVLGLSVGADGAPVLPPLPSADIAAGTYPAMINILLALRRRDRDGTGCRIDVAMGENLFPMAYRAVGTANALRHWPVAGGDPLTGGSARYQIYRTRDDRFLAAAPLENKFWAKFAAIIGLPAELIDDGRDPPATKSAVAALIAGRDAAEWAADFAGADVCCSVVLSFEEALRDPHWAARGVFDRRVRIGARVVPALPSIIVPRLRAEDTPSHAPSLGDANGALLGQDPESI